MRIAAAWMTIIFGCTGIFSRQGSEEFRCEGVAASTPEQTEPYRLLAGTELLVCLGADGKPHGPHLERWGEAVAAEGSWENGLKEGEWITWRRDGAFQSKMLWKAGVEQGPWIAASEDGLLLEIEMVDGVAAALHINAERAAMPEWKDRKRVLGTKYADPLPQQ